MYAQQLYGMYNYQYPGSYPAPMAVRPQNAFPEASMNMSPVSSPLAAGSIASHSSVPPSEQEAAKHEKNTTILPHNVVEHIDE